MATATILALAPFVRAGLVENNHIIADLKVVLQEQAANPRLHHIIQNGLAVLDHTKLQDIGT